MILGFDTDFTDAGVRVELLPRRLLPGLQGDAQRLRDGADRGGAGDDGAPRRSCGRPSSTTRGRIGRRAIRSSTATGIEVGDWVFVGTLLVIALTGFLLEGVRIAMERSGLRRHPVRRLDRRPGAHRPQPHATLAGLRHGLWWFHGLLAITFVASIPYTKAAHMLTSFFSLSLRDPLAGKRLRGDPARAGRPSPPGTRRLPDFSALHLLQLDACTKCGRCHEACPANATGRPLSPRDVILELREQSNAAMHSTGIGGVIGQLLEGKADGERLHEAA